MSSSLVKVGSLADFRDQERVLLVFKKVASELERTDAMLTSHQQTKATEEERGGSEEVFVLFNPGLMGELFCIEATCPHSGGPLELGDIEEIGGEQCVVCPWHDYDFGLKTGLGTTHDLQACTLRVTVKDGEVLVDAPGRKLASVEGCPLVPSRLTASGAAVPERPKKSSVRESVNVEDNSLCYWTYHVLETRNPVEKVAMTKELYKKWMDRKIALGTQRRFEGVPPRDQQMQDAWSGKNRGKGGTMWAIDLACDIICRYADYRVNGKERLPGQFFDDFMKIANDEAKHFSLLSRRLEELGSYFGELPIHASLWESAQDTSDDLLSRLAIVHMVHEARGLDVNPRTIARFQNVGDHKSVNILNEIHNDEVTHVHAGYRWFVYICNKEGRAEVATFHEIVRRLFRGPLKPPFNEEDRRAAGLEKEWYQPLAA